MKRYAILAALLLGAATGCNNQTPVAGDNGKPAPAPPADAKALDPYVMPEKPAKSLSVRDAMMKSDGEKVVVTGLTPPENVKPYNAAVAAFILMAPEDLAREDVKEEMQCEEAATCPACKQLLDKYAVQVEVVDKTGAPLPTTVEGFRGLKPGSAITVEGTVHRHGKDKKLVKIVATKFYPG